MKTFLSTCAGALACATGLFSLPAQAGLYFGGAGLYAERNSYDDVDGSSGGKAILGYRSEVMPLFFEANYLDTGDAEVNGTDFEIGFSGYTLTVGAFLPLSYTGSGVWVRGGFYNGEAELREFGDKIDDSSTSGPVFGFGGVWKLDPNFGLRLEVESLPDVDDFADNETMSIVSLGLIYEFPERAPPRRVRRAPAAYTPPPPPPPRPEYRSEPTQNGERLLASTTLKSQPRHGSATLTTLPAGAIVQTGQRESNIEGEWTFVLYGRYSGWVPAGALER